MLIAEPRSILQKPCHLIPLFRLKLLILGTSAVALIRVNLKDIKIGFESPGTKYEEISPSLKIPYFTACPRIALSDFSINSISVEIANFFGRLLLYKKRHVEYQNLHATNKTSKLIQDTFINIQICVFKY